MEISQITDEPDSSHGERKYGIDAEGSYSEEQPEKHRRTKERVDIGHSRSGKPDTQPLQR